jgi:hypothetical protein
VVLELTKADFATVAAREVGYRIAEVVVERLDVNDDRDDGVTVEALAFVSSWGMEMIDGPLPPTAPYRDKILDGLETYGGYLYLG